MKFILKNLSIFILVTVLFSCDNEPVDLSVNTDDLISVNSELYNQLERISNNGETSEGNITCIEFIYPVALYVFNDDQELLSSVYMSSDQEFSDFLASLDETYSISVSYPITSTLQDGSTISINTNEELKEAIDNCIREETIFECEQLIKNCIWKVGYMHETDNNYLGGIFQESNAATTFIFNNNLYFGTWNVFFIEDELHINISLNDNSQIATDMNFDWKVDYIDENSIKLTHEENIMVLHQYCDDDFALCNTFEFDVCEMETMPGYAEITTEDYTFCIKNILQIEDEEQYAITYFGTFDNALENINEIPQDQPYVNISPDIQYLYVKILNLEEDTLIIIELTINIVSC